MRVSFSLLSWELVLLYFTRYREGAFGSDLI